MSTIAAPIPALARPAPEVRRARRGGIASVSSLKTSFCVVAGLLATMALAAGVLGARDE